jgi:hypothetical protein
MTSTPKQHVKRALAALTLAGAALALAPAAAQADEGKGGALPGEDVVSQVLDVAQDPQESLEQAETATVAADEALGTGLAGPAPAVNGPLGALGGAAGLAAPGSLNG